MRSCFQPLKSFFRENLQRVSKFSFQFPNQQIKAVPFLPIISEKTLNPCLIPFNYSLIRSFEFHVAGRVKTTSFLHSLADSDGNTEFRQYPDDQIAEQVQKIFRNHKNSSNEETEKALDQCQLSLTTELVINIINRKRFDWEAAYLFFRWVSKKYNFLPGSGVYNEILDVLGRARRFDELIEVFDEMSERKGLVNEKTYAVLLNRYAAAHKVEESIEIFKKRKEFCLEDDLFAFQSLLMWLCRYKHVEVAETFFESKKNEFGSDLKARNIILNGWCVLGNVYEAKRFWKDIIASKCKPDLYTYGTFINALTKKGKLGTAMKLFNGMWEKGIKPDVTICNCVIDALCYKKRIPQAFEVFREMRERGCSPNVATYNSLIRHLCKIRRMEKVYELVDEMEEKKGSCLPNDVTYNYLLKSSRRFEDVHEVLERMKRNECEMNVDTYNLVLKLYVKWGYEGVKCIWDKMEKNGMGPDRRSYVIMIHGLYDKGRLAEALSYYGEMTLKGMVPEPRTEILVNAMNVKLREEEERRKIGVKENEKSFRAIHGRRRKQNDR